MDIKKILIADEVSEKVVEALRAAGLTVDLEKDIAAQRLLQIINVSIRLRECDIGIDYMLNVITNRKPDKISLSI